MMFEGVDSERDNQDSEYVHTLEMAGKTIRMDEVKPSVEGL